VPSPAIDPDLSGGDSLERGFAHLRDDQPALASQAFHDAIESGDLNDAGRALAYWSIYIAERTLGHPELVAEALTSFVAAGQDVLDARGEHRYAVNANGDFVDRFDLEHRMARARAVLSVLWARKVATFGRTLGVPVPVQSDFEMTYFLELAPPCGEASDKQMSRQPSLRDRDVVVERITVRCHGTKDSAEYFFHKTGEGS
jgi:hypothetical protein